MKYILEIKPEYEANGIMILGARDSHLYVTTLEVKDLEELNSDYINEHYGDLQDDAYNKGYAQCQDDYSDALKHAKDTAYKKGFEDGKAVNDKGCEGCKYEGRDLSKLPCMVCSNSRKNCWTAKQTDDKIEVGDEVIYNNTIKCLVVRPETDERYAVLIDGNGYHHSADHRECKKTGRHFDIASILKEMQS